MNLQAKLQKAEEALKVAQEAAKAAKTSAYERGVLETEARLIAEVTVVCKEYCAKTYNQAFDWARIPTDSDLRRVDQVYYPEDQVYYPEDLRENTTAPSPPAVLPFPPPEQSLTTQEPSQGAELPAGAEKKKKGEVMASRIEEKAKEKVKNKADANPSEDALTIGDMVSKAKTTESKSKIDSKKDSHQSQT